LLLLAALLLAPGPYASAAAAEPDMFDLVKVAEGVYAATARKAFPMNCNAAVIINEDDVLVVDSHATPRAAAALRRQIRKLTPLPVRFVVNTHFHNDHSRGNQAYVAAGPVHGRAATIVATEATALSLRTIEGDRLKKDAAEIAEKVQAARATLEAARNAESRTQSQARYDELRRYEGDLAKLELVLPSLTFDRSLILHRKTRDILILFLGRGHTNGDAVVYLPKEKVVVTGDLVTRWGPGMGDGFPNEWPATLDALLALDFTHVIGGHGAPGGRELVTRLRAYLTDLVSETKKEAARSPTADAAVEALVPRLVPKHAAAFDPGEFESRFPGNVKKVYEDVKAGRY
jgi:glyoxylase-like metal-dependent hydrolase (beta-lactamase superfamily II)